MEKKLYNTAFPGTHLKNLNSLSSSFHQLKTFQPQLRTSKRTNSEPYKKTISLQNQVRLQKFYLNNKEKNKSFPTNFIKTTKYNLITFFPKALLIQFRRLPNVYFLSSAIIQSLPIVSPLSSITAILPLICVLLVSIVRELIEDLQRSKYDQISNKEKYKVFDEGKFVQITSENIRIGEIIYLEDNAVVPADMIVIDSSNEEGVAYVQTSSLDGEKGIKEKVSNNFTIGLFKKGNINKLSLSGYCECDAPNPDLYKLDGKMKITYSIKEGEESTSVIPLDSQQFILKGSVLMYTRWVVGVVIYTGMQNKIIMNIKKSRTKISSIEQKMSVYLIGIFTLQMILCSACSICHRLFYKLNKEFYEEFILLNVGIDLESFRTFFTYFLLLNTLIPISLIVTLELVKMFQGFFINWDVLLYSNVKKIFCKAKTVSLNEELGNVNYIFTDKTGTLTCNKMQFKYCVINGKCYEYCPSLGDKESSKSKERLDVTIKQFTEGFFKNYLYNNKIFQFWTALACAHECICSVENGEYNYSGISADEVELVKAAHGQGITFLKSNRNERRVLVDGKERIYKILHILNFSSERKRMGIVIQDQCGKIILYVKGADCEIIKRLSQDPIGQENSQNLNQTMEYIDLFAKEGFRTLLIAYKDIDLKTYRNWEKRLKECQINLIRKKALVKQCYEEMENNLTLLGATIVEDKLQENVPETIRELRLAGIKFWVLTGDKADTAENISLSCNLISKSQNIFRLTRDESYGNGRETVSQKIYNFLFQFKHFISEKNVSSELHYFLKKYKSHGISSNLSHSSVSPLHSQTEKKQAFNILIDSLYLAHIFASPEKTKMFLHVAFQANSVICCRVSPLQKSQVVKFFKMYDPSNITLAIGDGGNDVSMINEAHIGIGVHGEEGLRAVQASDYSIAEFQFLGRLLLFHGRVNSVRISTMILYFFYKNSLFTITHFFFCFFCLSSGQTIIDDWFITFYNLIFTAFPLAVKACTEIDFVGVNEELDKNIFPMLYKENRDVRRIFTLRNFIVFNTKGIIIGLINFFFVIYSCKNLLVSSGGTQTNLWYLSTVIYTNIIVSVTLTLLLYIRHITSLFILVILITTFAFYYLFCLIADKQSSFNSFGIFKMVFYSPGFYLTAIAFCSFSAIIDFSFLTSQVIFGSGLISQLIRASKGQGKVVYLSSLLSKNQISVLREGMKEDMSNSNIILNENSMSKFSDEAWKKAHSIEYLNKKKPEESAQCLRKSFSISEQKNRTHVSNMTNVFQSEKVLII